MIIKDRIYGKLEINTQAILELINSKPLKRLKGIAQFGVPDEFYHLPNYSRYEHSLGVMLLLKKLGATEEEQIAGLLHDVSHTAFSHVIDWVVGDGKTEDYQDQQHGRYITNSEIPVILERFGYSVKRIIDYHNFGLLERDLPDLCADRVDYSLREFPTDVVATCMSAMSSKDNKIVFINEQSALLFASNFLKQQMEHWGGFEAASRYRLFADVLRQTLKEGTITEDDFWQNDNFVINKIAASKNKDIQNKLNTLRNKSLKHLPKSNVTVYKKFRYVDPQFVNNNKLVRLSKTNQEYAQRLEKARETNELGIVVPSVAEIS